MRLRTIGAAFALAATALGVAPAVAAADDPEFPRNGIIPPGTYVISRHPANVVGSPLENCELQVFVDGTTTVLVCGQSSRPGRQRPVGSDETYVSFDGVPIGLDLRDIDPRQGFWIGTPNIANTGSSVLYNLAGISLHRR